MALLDFRHEKTTEAGQKRKLTVRQTDRQAPGFLSRRGKRERIGTIVFLVGLFVVFVGTGAPGFWRNCHPTLCFIGGDALNGETGTANINYM
jgi:hypothetical protein